MSNDYGYINARIRAMKSFLLSEGDYLGALRQRKPEGLVSFLSSLPSYSNDFRNLLARQPTRLIVDEALKLNLCRIFRKIIRFCDGEPKRLLQILLMPWDIYNLTTIARGLLSHKDKNEILQTLIPAGKWDLNVLTQLAQANAITQLANTLSMFTEDELVDEFISLLRGFSLDSPLEILENAFMALYFQKASCWLERRNNNFRIVSDYLSLKIDFLNIISVLKVITQPHLSLAMLKGGRMREAFLKELTQLKSIEEALGRFQQSPYPWLGKEGLDLYRKTKRLSSLEGLLRQRLLWFCVEMYTHGDPLSIAVPLAFINFKEIEIVNLRLISNGISFGVPEDLIREELTYYA